MYKTYITSFLSVGPTSLYCDAAMLHLHILLFYQCLAGGYKVPNRSRDMDVYILNMVRNWVTKICLNRNSRIEVCIGNVLSLKELWQAVRVGE